MSNNQEFSPLPEELQSILDYLKSHSDWVEEVLVAAELNLSLPVLRERLNQLLEQELIESDGNGQVKINQEQSLSPKTKTVEIILKNPRELIPHPINSSIYGENEDVSDLVERIKESDWIETIVATPDGKIISGNRRVKAALILDWNLVEVEIRHFDSELEEIEALLLENQYRQKTTEQQVREGQQWEQIEREKARQRQSEGAKSTNQKLEKGDQETLRVNLPQASFGRTRDKVAEKVGMKGSSYERAKKVIEKIDALSNSNPAEAEKLRRLLNKKSVNSAYKKMKEVSTPKESSETLSVAHHLKLQPRGLVEINTPHLIDLHQRYARIHLIHENTVEVWVRNMGSMTMRKQTLKHQQVQPVPFEKEPQLLEVRSRLEKLRKQDLDPFDREILMLLERPVAFTPREMEYLASLEARYGIEKQAD